MGARLCATTAAGTPLPDDVGLTMLKPAMVDAADSPDGVVVGGGAHAHVTVVAWAAPHAPGMAYRGANLFVYEEPMPPCGTARDVGRCIEVRMHRKGYEYACAANYHYAHGGCWCSADAPDAEYATAVLYNQRRDLQNLARLGRGDAIRPELVDDVLRKDFHALQSMRAAPSTMSAAERSRALVDAFVAADAAGLVTLDNASGGASATTGWRERVQTTDEEVKGFYPLRLRRRNLRPEIADMMTAAAPTFGDAAAAFRTCAPWVYNRMHAACGMTEAATGGRMLYPARHCQTADPCGPVLSFLSCVLRMKGPDGLDPQGFDRAVVDGPVGMHSDHEDSDLGMIVGLAIARPAEDAIVDPVVRRRTAREHHQGAWQRLRLQLRLRGGAFDNAERAARRRENERRRRAGQPRLPRGGYDSIFNQEMGGGGGNRD